MTTVVLPFSGVLAVNTAAIVVGRLLEIRLEAGYRSLDDVERVMRTIHRQVAKLPLTARVVSVVDWRRCPLMQEEAAARLVESLRSANTRLERSAALASQKSPIAVLQFLRLVRESNNPDRRLFHAPEPLIQWLGEVLTPEEVARLQAFLAEGNQTTE